MKLIFLLATIVGIAFSMDFPWNRGTWHREQLKAADDLIVPQRDAPPPPPDFPAEFVVSNISTSDLPLPQEITQPQTATTQNQTTSEVTNTSTTVSTSTTSSVAGADSRIPSTTTSSDTASSDASTTTNQVTDITLEPVAIEVEEQDPLKAELEDMQSGNDTTGVNFVVIALGPGNQNPARRLRGSEWDWEGPKALTKIGKLQAYHFGRILRERYGNFLKSFKRTRRYASNQCAIQGTLQTFLAGMFPATGDEVWLDSWQWQPIAYHVAEEVLNLTAQECPAFREVKETVEGEHTLFAQKALEKTEKVFAELSNTSDGVVPTLAAADEVAQNLLQLWLLQRPLPEWANQQVGNETLGDLVVDMVGLSDYLCAEYEPCRHFAAGAWLHDILKSLKEGPESNRTAQIYATGSKELLSLLWLLGLQHERLQGGSGLLIEYRSQPQPSVRLVFAELEHQTRFESRRYQAMKFNGCDGQWCSLARFTGLLQKKAIQDWKQECQVENCINRDLKKPTESIGKTIAELQDVPDGVNLRINCKRETDVSGETYCENWADHNYCAQYISVRDFYCRKTCLCKEKYRAQLAAKLNRRR